MKLSPIFLGAAIARFLYKENTEIGITNYYIELEHLPQSFDHFTIIQVSDYHNTYFGFRAHHLLKRVRECNGDIIVVTGDIVDRRTPYMKRALHLAHQLSKILPTYYITGNHEAHYRHVNDLLHEIHHSNMTHINDGDVTIRRGQDSIRLYGMNDPWFFGTSEDEKTYANFESALNRQSFKEGVNILLSHRPELLHMYAQLNIDLVLSGHAHGGQIRLPKVGGLYAPHQGALPKYTKGVHVSNGTHLIVSRGLGNSRFPFRLFNRPEVVRVILKKK